MILNEIMRVLMLMHGVWLARNQVGTAKTDHGQRIRFGAGKGSPDLMGSCTRSSGLCRPFHLEVKRPGEKPSPDQVTWHEASRARGEFCAVVHSVEEAVAAVARCRNGEFQ